jgi:outer membrane receptor for ferric coprogen and ferric-rhodotorulic acid
MPEGSELSPGIRRGNHRCPFDIACFDFMFVTRGRTCLFAGRSRPSQLIVIMRKYNSLATLIIVDV